MQSNGPAQKFCATPWLAQELVPHHLVCRQPDWRRRPTLGQAQVGIQPMRNEDWTESVARPRAKIVGLPVQPRFDELRALQVEIVSPHLAVSIDVHLHRPNEIGILKRALQDLDMPRQPQIVVVMDANYLAVRLAQHVVTIKFANACRLRQVKEADTRIGLPQLSYHC